MALEEKPFQNREDVKHEVKLCSSVASVFQILSLLFAVVGVIGDGLNMTLGLETLSWFLLAIIFGVSSVLPSIHVVSAKQLLYMVETKKEQ